MKKTLIVLAHPSFIESKINKRLLEEVKKSGEFTVLELYKEYGKTAFDEKLNAEKIAADRKLIEEHERIVLQFPFFWYTAPALMKQWIDEVFIAGWAYMSDAPKTKGKELAIAISTGGDATAYSPAGYNNYYVDNFFFQFIQTAKLCMMTFSGAFAVQGAARISPEVLEQKAAEYIKFLKS